MTLTNQCQSLAKQFSMLPRERKYSKLADDAAVTIQDVIREALEI